MKTARMEGFVKAGRRRGAQLYLTKICCSNSTQAVLEVLGGERCVESEVHEPHSFDCCRALFAPYVAAGAVGIEALSAPYVVDGREPLDGHWVDCQVLVGCSELLLDLCAVLAGGSMGGMISGRLCGVQ